MKHNYGLGIDAGGTYTDAVILDFSTGKVVASRKAPTTQPDPSGGIRAALERLDPDLLGGVGMVSLATTFATNAIVEDRGAEAGLILIGYPERPAEIPAETRVLMLNGGHTVSGEEKAPLDLFSLEEKLDPFLSGIDAVAVAGIFSVRNPDHELRVSAIIRERRGLPVVRGHRLSMRLDAVKRATTAWWNARLIPLISRLIHATTTMLSERNVRAPLMVVRGDGTLMSAKTALDRPVDTLLSGPAASILGAKHLSGLSDALIVDMGGTTTDMAVLKNGKVAVDPSGAEVGRWKTHVEAARVRTIGLGGDSLISANGNGLPSVGPRRVIPLCVAAGNDSKIVRMLETVLRMVEGGGWRSANPSTFYQRIRGETEGLPECLRDGPVSEYLLCADAASWQCAWDLDRLERRGLVLRASLTPTDIHVATGSISLGDRDAAVLGLKAFSRHMGMDPEAFARVVDEEIGRRVCLEAVSHVGDEKDAALGELVNRWYHRANEAPRGVDLKLEVSLTAPVVAVGAPAAEYLPPAFERLHTVCILPENYEVSVAVGAVVGVVDARFTGVVRVAENGRYVLHTDLGREEFRNHEAAVEKGRKILEELALIRMRQDLVAEPLMEFTIERKRYKSRFGTEETDLETVLSLRATGRPSVNSLENPNHELSPGC